MNRVRLMGLVCLFSVLIGGLGFSTNAHAIDKRLKLAFKTASYGAGAGFVIGAGTMVMGLGGYRNILMGTSSGMYAGLLLAAYLVATPNEDESRPARGKGPRNPYAPRKPVGPDDYDTDEEGLEQHLPPRREDDSRLMRDGVKVALGAGGVGRPSEVLVWTPLVSVQF